MGSASETLLPRESLCCLLPYFFCKFKSAHCISSCTDADKQYAYLLEDLRETLPDSTVIFSLAVCQALFLYCS